MSSQDGSGPAAVTARAGNDRLVRWRGKVGSLRANSIAWKSITDAQLRERNHLLREVATVRGFMPLLMKPRNGGRWTRTERQELTEQLRALAHLSPYLVLMVLPGSFVALPLLAWWLDRRRLLRKP